MDKFVNLTIIVDNKTEGKASVEHGLSILIDNCGTKTLLDTAQEKLFENAALLDVDLSQIENLVLSHGHYDHTGDIHRLLTFVTPMVYLHPLAFRDRFSLRGDKFHSVNMLDENRVSLKNLSASKLNLIEEPILLSDNMGITDSIPRVEECEDTGGNFFLDSNGDKKDLIEDDIALWIKTSNGLVICLGCCHSGVMNTVNYIKELTGTDKIHTIIGGMHLLHAGTERLNKTIEFLNKLNLNQLIPCHCTGDIAVEMFKKKIDCKVVEGAAGCKLSIPL